MATIAVVPGQTVKANKQWRNLGADGTKDVMAVYGPGAGSALAVVEFLALARDVFCAGGNEIVTPLEVMVPIDVSPGLKACVVGVGDFDEASGLMLWETSEFVPAVFDVVADAYAAALAGNAQVAVQGDTVWSLLTGDYPVPAGLEVEITNSWRNNSPVPITGHIDVTVQTPSGGFLYPPITLGQDQTVGDGMGSPNFLFAFIPIEQGLYTIGTVLSIPEAVLDTQAHTIVAMMTAVIPEETGISFEAI